MTLATIFPWFKQKTRTYSVVFVLTGIIFVGFALRTYHFADWLHFEIDQSYDTQIISQAVDQGIGNLPLLGPTAGGGRSLRLGPAFYYLEYASAKLFGNTPAGHAAAVPLLSILAHPLFYFFCRRYFTVPLALALLALFSVSAYIVLFSRFSWSPNVLPFFIIASFYALLRSVSPREQHRERFFLAAVTFLTLITQIHFNAFFIVPAIAISFLLIKRPRFSWRTWVLAVSLSMFLYSPVLINEWQTGGENFQFFQEKLTKSQPKNPDIRGTLIEDVRHTAAAYFFIISGQGIIDSKTIPHSLWTDDGNAWYWPGLLFLLSGVAVLAWNIRKEKNPEKRDFLILITLWFSWSFLFFYSLISGYRVYPRFFLLVSPLPIIFCGLLLERLRYEKNMWRLAIFASIILALILSNLSLIKNSFTKHAENSFDHIPTGDVFPDTHRINITDQLAVIDYILSKKEGNTYPVYLQSFQEIEPALWYHLNRRGVFYQGALDADHVYTEGNYFLINSDPRRRDLMRSFDVEEKKQFGVFIVYHLTPFPQAISALRQDPLQKETYLQTEQISKLLTWKKVFSR